MQIPRNLIDVSMQLLPILFNGVSFDLYISREWVIQVGERHKVEWRYLLASLRGGACM